MLTPGAKLGPYEILAPLGAGGMGEVYKARDTRLDRLVAIKILPPQLADTPEVRQRFEREARAVSSLNHPHICTLYDVGHQDGTDYLVMEYLEGETLAKRLERGALEPAQLLPIAIDIANALDAAHRRGVIHRDLKPGNVMLTRAGAKLLDFGLAKAAIPAKVDLMRSPTVSQPLGGGAALTAAGTIVGTFQYMAPEQLEGKEADARSDIFSFGAVLYEMATGRKAFVAKSHASLIAAILKDEPRPINELQPASPLALDRLVRTCLLKDPEERIQTAHDLKLQLEGIGEAGAHAGAPAARSARRGGRERLAWAVIPVLLLAAIALTIFFFSRAAPSPEPPVQASLLPPEGTAFGRFSFALSPDGTKLAFAAGANGATSLWVRSLDTTVAQQLAGTGGALHPFWSPDGKSLGFFARGKLDRVDAAGGPVVTLAAIPNSAGASWSADGSIIVTTSRGLLRVASTGGAVTVLEQTGGRGKPVFGCWPFLLPDGRHMLMHALAAGSSHTGLHVTTGSGIYVVDLSSGDASHVLNADSGAQYAGGYLFFLQQGSLMAQRFDASSLRLSGSPQLVAQGIAFNSLLSEGAFTVSENGRLAYRAGKGNETQLIWYTRDGKNAGQLAPPANFMRLVLSPDGTRAATSVPNSQGGRDLWVYDLKRQTTERFTFEASQADIPVWSHDGTRIYYWDVGAQGGGIYAKASEGTGTPELVIPSPGVVVAPNTLSPDGKYLVYTYLANQRPQLWIHSFAAGTRDHPLLRIGYVGVQAQFSPDGHWLAYSEVSGERGTAEIYIAPFPSLSGKWQISTAGGSQPRWRRDGKELYFVTPDGELMAEAIDTAGGALNAGTPQALFPMNIVEVQFDYWEYDASANGRKFLVNSIVGENTQPITLYMNWPAELKK